MRPNTSPNTKVSRLLLLAGASPDAISDYLDGAPLMGVFANQVKLDTSFESFYICNSSKVCLEHLRFIFEN